MSDEFVVLESRPEPRRRHKRDWLMFATSGDGSKTILLDYRGPGIVYTENAFGSLFDHSLEDLSDIGIPIPGDDLGSGIYVWTGNMLERYDEYDHSYETEFHGKWRRATAHEMKKVNTY